MGGLSGHMKHLYEATNLSVLEIENLVYKILASQVTDLTEKIDGYNIHVGYDFEKQELRFFRNSKDILSKGMSVSDMKERWKDNPKTLKVYLSAADILKKYIEDHWIYLLSIQENYMITLNVECVYKMTNIMPYTEVGVYLHNIWDWDKRTGKCESIIDIPDGLKMNIDKYKGVHICPTIKISPRFSEKEYRAIAGTYKEEFLDIIRATMGTDRVDHKNLVEYYLKKFKTYCKASELFENIPESTIKIVFDRIFFDIKTVNLRELVKHFQGKENDFRNWLEFEGQKVKENCMYDLKLFFTKFANFVLSNAVGYVNYENRYIISDLLYRTYKQKSESLEGCTDPKKKEVVERNINLIESTGTQINALEGVVLKYKDNLYKLTGTFAPLNQLLWM